MLCVFYHTHKHKRIYDQSCQIQPRQPKDPSWKGATDLAIWNFVITHSPRCHLLLHSTQSIRGWTRSLLGPFQLRDHKILQSLVHPWHSIWSSFPLHRLAGCYKCPEPVKKNSLDSHLGIIQQPCGMQTQSLDLFFFFFFNYEMIHQMSLHAD